MVTIKVTRRGSEISEEMTPGKGEVVISFDRDRSVKLSQDIQNQLNSAPNRRQLERAFGYRPLHVYARNYVKKEWTLLLEASLHYS